MKRAMISLGMLAVTLGGLGCVPLLGSLNINKGIPGLVAQEAIGIANALGAYLAARAAGLI